MTIWVIMMAPALTRLRWLMFRFEFELRPLAAVPPWGGDHPRLHWFGLTSGWYWISAQGYEFLRYSHEAVRTWDLERPYPDYYVARLWEDLIVLRWALQEPVPEDLISFVDGTFLPREFPVNDDDFGDDVDAAFSFQSDYALDLGYLTDAPQLTCWRHAVDGSDVVTLSQQIPPRKAGTFDGRKRLDVTVPAAELFAAFDNFDRRFIAAMEDRVAELERGPLPAIDLDLQHLRVEHTQRSSWLERRLGSRRDVDWTKVRAGVAQLRSWPPAR